MKTSRLYIRCTPDLREALFAHAYQEATQPSRLVARVLSAFLAQNGVNLSNPPAPIPKVEGRAIRVSLRFSEKEYAALTKLAGPFGSVRSWLVALARSRIHRGVPQLTGAEIDALSASNRELWAIGRNLNQIARAFNQEIRQGGRLGQVEERLAMIEEVRTAIQSHTRQVVLLCNLSMNRWEGE